MKCDCGNEIDPNPLCITTAGGWCAPSEVMYDLPKPEPVCSDCKTRMLMVMEIGIDPGHNGENLRFPRGGITYGR